MKDLPIEVIYAIKTLTNYLVENGYSDAQISYLGFTKLLKPDNETEDISPMAIDFMLMRLEGYFGQVIK